jgi:hypothetical protein
VNAPIKLTPKQLQLLRLVGIYPAKFVWRHYSSSPMQKLLGHGMIRVTRATRGNETRGWYALTLLSKGRRFLDAQERRLFP